jgi:hypothetical protein
VQYRLAPEWLREVVNVVKILSEMLPRSHARDIVKILCRSLK